MYLLASQTAENHPAHQLQAVYGSGGHLATQQGAGQGPQGRAAERSAGKSQTA